MRMNWIGRPAWILITFALTAFFWNRFTFAESGVDKPSYTVALPERLSSELPYDVDPKTVQELVREGKILEAQRLFDLLAWQAFIALNWPADSHGAPDPLKNIADTAEPRVWNFWRTPDTIFLKDGATPEPWSDVLVNSTQLRWKAAWRQHTTQASSLEAFSGPLVDQNGKWVRYQIRINKEEFDYILKNELFSQDGQAKFSQKEQDNEIKLPINDGQSRHGAIEIKLAWKELGKNDDPTRFYVTDLVSDLSEATKPGEPVPQRTVHVGLVGMHISMRTESSPEWIWSTFEQVDNVRVNYVDGEPTHPNFWDPARPQPVNVIPAPNAIQDAQGKLHIVDSVNESASKWVESLTTTPVQVVRIQVPTQPALNPWDAKTARIAKEVNTEVQALLQNAHSVFRYYELIDVQWPVHPNAPAAAGGNDSAPESITNKTPGDVIPVFLVNTTMETYFQKGPQAAGALEQDDRLAPNSAPIDSKQVFGTESCVGCHYSSGVAIGFKKDKDGNEVLTDGLPTAVFGENNHFGKTGGANFSWMLQLEPQPKPRNVSTSTKANLVPSTTTPKLPGVQN